MTSCIHEFQNLGHQNKLTFNSISHELCEAPWYMNLSLLSSFALRIHIILEFHGECQTQFSLLPATYAEGLIPLRTCSAAHYVLGVTCAAILYYC